MEKKYSQLTALYALTKGSLIGLFKSPSAIFFSIAFPLIFITVFGVMGDSGMSVNISFDKKTDTLNPIYAALNEIKVLKVVDYNDTIKMQEDFIKGKIGAIIHIENTKDTLSPYNIHLNFCDAAGNDSKIASQIILSTIDNINKNKFPNNRSIAKVIQHKPISGRQYKYLDFFLPGMLGFSMLSAGIFGTAFVFFTLRQTLVLKRFFATPVKRIHIILSEGISRLFLQLLSSAIIILAGHFLFGFTLVHGFVTFIQMLIVCILGLVIFLGMGFVVSSIAKNEANIPPFANMITMPQLLLSGVFVGVGNFPAWLQPICKALPLTQVNDMMRSIAFEGNNIFQCYKQLGILALWGMLVYIIAIKVFRWE